MSAPTDADSGRPTGLVLDDYLHALADVRRQFGLPTPKFGLKKILTEPAANAALDTLLKEVSTRHGSNVFSKGRQLLAELGLDVYAEEIATPVDSWHRIRPDVLSNVLQRAIELALQTIVQLPTTYPKPVSVPKRLKATAKGLKRAAEKLEDALGCADVTSYMDLWDDVAGRVRLRSIPGELRWTIQALQMVAALKVKRVRRDSPNPQVTLAMYILGWLELATGSFNYEKFATLLRAAFFTARETPPKWTDRLSIEMLSKRRWRKKWARAISSKS